jgi:uncharacterized membrane protein YccC
VGKARDWIAAHRAEITLSLRITVAGLIAFVLGELLSVKQIYWAVLTAVIVMQASVGGSLKATIDRLAGTVAGALWGAALGAAIPHPGTLATAGLLAAALLPLAALVASGRATGSPRSPRSSCSWCRTATPARCRPRSSV